MKIKARTHVVLKVVPELIEGHHPAFTEKGAGGTRTLTADAAILYRQFAASCEEYYPTPASADEREDGVAPEPLMAVVREGMRARQSATPLQAKMLYLLQA